MIFCILHRRNPYRQDQIFISVAFDRFDQARGDAGVEFHSDFFIIDDFQRIQDVLRVKADIQASAAGLDDQVFFDVAFFRSGSDLHQIVVDRADDQIVAAGLGEQRCSFDGIHHILAVCTNEQFVFLRQDVSVFDECTFQKTHDNLGSLEQHDRLFLTEYVPETVDKVLYLDCDLIVNSDIAKLFTTDVSGYMLAATLDPDFLGQIGGADLNTQEYVQTKLQLKNPANYFQAGVILFNEEEMRKSHSIQEWLGYAETPYRYNDQDVLNLYCEGRVKFFDMSWNLITDMEFKRFSNVISYASATVQNQYEKAHQNPAIIHYAGCIKPWNRPEDDLARYFWKELRKTPYYETVLANLCRNGAKHKSSSGKITEVVNQIFPVSTKRRAWLDRVYMKLHR